MSRPIDVLAALDAGAEMLNQLDHMDGELEEIRNSGDDVAEARAAVAELLEAATALDDKAMQKSKLLASVYTKHVMRLRAALARCKGGAA